MPSSPLAHLRVVDLTDIRGALAGRLLADLGADVIKVEAPNGDPARLRPPFAGNVAGADRSLPFLFRNANKRGAVIDLHDPDGWHRFLGLCDAADILIDNFGPVAARQHGLSPEEVRARHPHLIHVVIADFGLSGPRVAWRAEPLPALAASGALHPCGFPDRPPCGLPGYLAHDCAAVIAVVGALAAVLERGRDHQGQTVEISVQDAALNGINPWAIPLEDYRRLYPLVPASPPRNADGTYLVMATADGYVRVLAGTVRHWRAFQALLGNPEVLAGPEWEMAVFRLLNADVIRAVASDALNDRRREEVFATARRLGLPLAPVQTPEEFVAAEQTTARGYFRRTGFAHLGDAPFAPAPFNFSRTPISLRRAAPGVGEDDHAGFAARPAAKSPPAAGVEQPILSGLRVIDLGVGAVGPEIGWVMVELGAEVIKIESRTNLDFLRAVTVEPDRPNRAWTFNDECRGQKSVCLDLKTEPGRELALRLCATADIIIENNRGGVVQQWGLDYEDVRRVRPDVIYVTSQGFGRGGPLGQAQAFGPLNSAFAGINWLWNYADAPYPAGVALNHPDHIASKMGAAAVLAALEHRRLTGEGQLIEMAQTEAAVFLLGEFYLREACTGRPVTQQGNHADYAAPHGVYPCAGEDTWCAIAVVSDDDWNRFVIALGWAADPALATVAQRLAVRDQLDARVADWTRTRTADEVAAHLQAHGVSAAAVESPDDLRADPQLAARDAIVTVEHPEIGPERHSGNPLRMSRTRFAPPSAAPLLDADTEEVLTRVLGLSADDVQRLVEQGVCR